MTDESLRIALLVYRGNPHSGGQGVYTRYLARELTELGHRVTVFAGQPWPLLDDGVGFVPVPSLDLYRQPDPFRVPKMGEFRSAVDVMEFALMCTAGFPEPRTFSIRVRRALAARRGQFDVVHDNQTFGRALLGIMSDGWPVLGTCHHPITVDRVLDLAHADGFKKRLTVRRWYGFVEMQKRVARRFPRVVTVSESSKRDIVEQMGLQEERVQVVPIGADHTHFRPHPEIAKVPGRIMTTASADAPMKGLIPLLEALAKLRVERPDAHLLVVGRLKEQSPVAAAIARLGLSEHVTFASGVSDDRLVELYAEAQVAVVPSLYEGFSLPAVEAMACGVPLVTTTGGALPEVVGADGVTGMLVAPGDPGQLTHAISRVLEDDELSARLSVAGRARVLERFTWQACAAATAEHYRWVLDRARAEQSAVGSC
ncbi:glycosyltransferase family 4 protein [Acidiferrimicrobium sp. IK]|uniref:glycosyltransferase family 4 protein n=1 Tax=Acidiferrimicrobium sp. IK TaxID=2871700 RepID=UPI0021CB0705|nr:glycosyltransferase family 4 protein [Acidiferrimicrobium sp. IK]MCU4186927.1 glycosyltransferase family 4 protein [Acidiferrimicrobium sp. IK]